MGFFRLLFFISHLPSFFANNTIVHPLFCCISIAHPSYTPTRATPPKFCQVLATSAWYEIFFYRLVVVIFSTNCSCWSHTYVPVITPQNPRRHGRRKNLCVPGPERNNWRGSGARR